eukprot:CAMPEP_0119550674 /NCGR_PEP_ID=MMETSP1352-20130426/4151_1 /TAXON_ID=265584 /ORGANISM="Stauroneis constricta, Strain CCMP1120" /LENGTH=129 /DNA_ID=CAMNT_0007596601 /DNA_START=154 /DNA_END=543 /DNA_ORIENTATION=-
MTASDVWLLLFCAAATIGLISSSVSDLRSRSWLSAYFMTHLMTSLHATCGTSELAGHFSPDRANRAVSCAYDTTGSVVVDDFSGLAYRYGSKSSSPMALTTTLSGYILGSLIIAYSNECSILVWNPFAG